MNDRNLFRLLLLLTPPYLRKSLWVIIMRAVANPLQRIFDAFVEFKKEPYKRILYGPQICRLRAAICAELNTDEVRIVDDIVVATIVYKRDEEITTPLLPEVSGDDGDNVDDILLASRKSVQHSNIDFYVVNVPHDKATQVKAIVDRYKLASMRYKIITK